LRSDTYYIRGNKYTFYDLSPNCYGLRFIPADENPFGFTITTALLNAGLHPLEVPGIDVDQWLNNGEIYTCLIPDDGVPRIYKLEGGVWV
jgi:hypothetical protein